MCYLLLWFSGRYYSFITKINMSKLKVKKIDEMTFEVDDGEKVRQWTIETLGQTMVQAEKDKKEPYERIQFLDERVEYCETAGREARKLGIKTRQEIEQEKAEAEKVTKEKEEKSNKDNKKEE